MRQDWGSLVATGSEMMLPEMPQEESLQTNDASTQNPSVPDAGKEPVVVSDPTAGPLPNEPQSGFDSAEEFRETPALPFAIVAIGSSAGGLEPCLELFD